MPMQYASRLALVAVLVSMALSTTAIADPHAHIPDGTIVPVVCYNPGTEPAVVARTQARFDAWVRDALENDPFSKFQFPDNGRWSSTATNGGGLGQGDPTTVTWSIVPDGTFIFGFNGEPSSPSNLRLGLNNVYGNMGVWLPIFQQVFARWSRLSGVTYVYEPNDDGAALNQNSQPGGVLGVRGDVRISGHFIDGTSNVLAYNFFPNVGDMVIDTGDSSYANTSNNSLLLRNTVAHELGHGLGLRHVCPVTQSKLMEPFISNNFDGPQFDDILAANRGYGDPNENNDAPGIATDFGSIASGSSFSQNDLTIDDNSDPDFFSFTVGPNSTASVTITPLGFNYLSGPQNSNGSCSPGTPYNALDNQNLVLRLLDRDGSTVLGSANATGAGGIERLTNLALPAAGTYFVDVSGPNNEAQVYEAAVSVGTGGGGGGNIAFGNLANNHVTQTQPLTGFTTPRVVAGPPGYIGTNASTIRVRNVTATSFDHNIQEWDYLDGGHAVETYGYLALDNGPQDIGSLDAEAGTVSINQVWKTVNFSQSFGAPPVVIAQVASIVGGSAVTTRLRNITTSSFQIRLKEEQANDQTHSFERVDWVAVEPGTTTFGGTKLVAGRSSDSVTHLFATLSFSSVTNPVFLADMQTWNGGDNCDLRFQNLTSNSVQVKVEEEQSADAEIAHTTEVVGFLVLGSP